MKPVFWEVGCRVHCLWLGTNPNGQINCFRQAPRSSREVSLSSSLRVNTQLVLSLPHVPGCLSKALKLMQRISCRLYLQAISTFKINNFSWRTKDLSSKVFPKHEHHLWWIDPKKTAYNDFLSKTGCHSIVCSNGGIERSEILFMSRFSARSILLNKIMIGKSVQRSEKTLGKCHIWLVTDSIAETVYIDDVLMSVL